MVSSTRVKSACRDCGKVIWLTAREFKDMMPGSLPQCMRCYDQWWDSRRAKKMSKQEGKT